MSYYHGKVTDLSFEEAVEKAIAELKQEGFGVLTQIDVQQTMKEKLGVDLRSYRILGACNPQFAYKALQAEEKIGTMLPCNVIVLENASGQIEVAAVDPVASMQAIENPELADVAQDVQAKLRAVIDRV